MPFSTDAIANYFLECADRDSLPLSPMKLQKLMYFAHGWHLALENEGRPLVGEKVQAWEFGPVFPSTYHEFKEFGAQPIIGRAMEVRVIGAGEVELYPPSVEDEKSSEGVDLPFAKAVLDRVWKVYSKYAAPRLSAMTHAKGSPWWTVRQQAKTPEGMVPKAVGIPNELIREWFRKRFLIPAA